MRSRSAWWKNLPEVALALLLIVLILAALYFVDNDPFIQAYFPGLLLDVFVFGILIVVFNKLAERRRDIKRWQEEIDDYRGWNEKEATYRIIGNIRRLNRHGITNIDLSFCYLREAKLGKDLQANVDRAEACLAPDMVSARSSGRLVRIPSEILEKEFKANLTGGDLTRADLVDANLSDVNLENAVLYRANLNGSYLFWANLKNANLRKAQLQYSSLGCAVLQDANLMDADLTGARGITVGQLSTVRTLFGAKLDAELELGIRQVKPSLLEKPIYVPIIDNEEARERDAVD